jgi:uncharacterized protein (DUF2267 family)
VNAGYAWSEARSSPQFYDWIVESAALKGRAEAKTIAVAVMTGLFARLPRLSAALIGESLPPPIPRLLITELAAGARFAPFNTLALEVAEELRVSPDTSEDYLRAVGASLEKTLDPQALECLRADIPTIAREILPGYIPVSSDRPSVLESSTPEPLCTSPSAGQAWPSGLLSAF